MKSDSQISIIRYSNHNAIECSICYVDFEKGEELYLTTCGHLFHKNCLRPWLQINTVCPNCREDLSDSSLQLSLPIPPHGIQRRNAFSEYDNRPYSQSMIRIVKAVAGLYRHIDSTQPIL